MDRRPQNERVCLEDRLEVGSQSIFQGADVRLGTEVGTAAAGHEVEAAQIHEDVFAAALLEKRLHQAVSVATRKGTPADTDDGHAPV